MPLAWPYPCQCGVGATLDAAKVQRFDAELATMLAAHHAEEPMAVPHRVWALITLAPVLPR